MPVEKIVRNDNQIWGLWKITEDETVLRNNLPCVEEVSLDITNTQKRLEWLAVRVLLQQLTHALQLPYLGLQKDEYGKPSLKASLHKISLSHSYPYVAVIIDATQEAGIDLEQPKEKLLRVAPRILSRPELEDAGKDLLKHAVYWCAKEALIKFYGKKDLTLAKNLQIDSFTLGASGQIIGRIIVNTVVTVVPLSYQVFTDFVMVHTAHKTN